MRIAIGGFQHETNTFAPTRASFEDLQRDGGWPWGCAVATGSWTPRWRATCPSPASSNR